jgi:type IV pilus assembly protein PilN
MIKINLLRETVSPRKKWTFDRSKIGVYSAVVLLLAWGSMGSWYWYLFAQRQDYTTQAEELQAENERLQAAKKQLDKYEEQKRLLSERIAVVERLQANQKGPVNLLNALLASIPVAPKLWLTNLSQKDTVINLEGQALDVPSIADFMASLGATRPFKRVELDYWEENQDRIKFELTCEVEN